MVGGVAQDRVDYSNKQRLNQPPIKIKNTKKVVDISKILWYNKYIKWQSKVIKTPQMLYLSYWLSKRKCPKPFSVSSNVKAKNRVDCAIEKIF